MNTKIIYGVSGLLIGSFLGGGTISFVATRSLRKRIKELEIQNEDLIAENHKIAQRGLRSREKGLKTQSLPEVKKDDTIKTEEKAKSRLESELELQEKQVKTDYAKLSKEYGSESFDEHFADRVGPTDEDDQEEDGEEDDDSDDDLIDDDEDVVDDTYRIVEYTGDPNGSIHQITSQEFRDDINYRDNDTFIYYQEDDVLTDSKNNVIQDHEKIIGSECMGIICDTEEDFIYLENEIEDKIYEIIVNHNDSLFRDIMGNPIYYDDKDTEDEVV